MTQRIGFLYIPWPHCMYAYANACHISSSTCNAEIFDFNFSKTFALAILTYHRHRLQSAPTLSFKTMKIPCQVNTTRRHLWNLFLYLHTFSAVCTMHVFNFLSCFPHWCPSFPVHNITTFSFHFILADDVIITFWMVGRQTIL